VTQGRACFTIRTNLRAKLDATQAERSNGGARLLFTEFVVGLPDGDFLLLASAATAQRWQ